MSSNAVLIALCAATLCASGYLIAAQPRVADLEARLAAAEKRADAVEALRSQVSEMSARIDRPAPVPAVAEPAAADDARPAVARVGGVSRVRFTGFDAARAAEMAAPEASGAKPIEELIADRVEKRVAERIEALAARDKERGADGKWKAPLDELAKELTLSEQQKTEAKRVFDAARDQGFVLLRTQRLDGGTILDDFAGALKGGADPEETTKHLFSRILTEKVPGSDQTYFTEFVAIHQDVHDQLARQLDKAQMKRLDALRVDLLDVKTGYDPVGDYVRARLQ